MRLRDFWNGLKTPEHRLAWMIAILADAVQIAAFPLFAEGAVSPADTVLDVLVAALLIRLLGWHWAFLPSLAAELLPGFDLFPTWTAAVFFVTRSQIKPGEPEILPRDQHPSRDAREEVTWRIRQRFAECLPLERGPARSQYPNSPLIS